MTKTNASFDYLDLENIPAVAMSRDIHSKERPHVGQIKTCGIPFLEAFTTPKHGDIYEYNGTKIHLYEKEGNIFAYSASRELPSYVLDSSIEVSVLSPAWNQEV